MSGKTVIDLEAKQRIEIEFWRDSEDERPDADSIHNIINKISEAAVFLDCLTLYRAEIATKGRVLEIGAGQGWASCVYKKLFPSVHITATDISDFAIASLHKWERLFEVTVDHSYSCKSYETQEGDASIDQVFCFAAAHHFVAHRRTLREIRRVLKPHGKAFLFYEPATPRYLYPLARARVNKKRPQVPEDVLISAELRKLALESGLAMRIDYYPSLIRRGPRETLYYIVLRQIPLLQRWLPCTANFTLTKHP